MSTQKLGHVTVLVKDYDEALELYVHKADYRSMRGRGVKFFGEPKDMPWGKEVVFEDLYGNRLDLLQITAATVP